jgi:hypothetical protein
MRFCELSEAPSGRDDTGMTWRGSTIDPSNDVAAAAVLGAFEAARGAGLASVDCYRSGVEAWRRMHPDQSAEYAAKQAVAVILAAKVSLRIDE